MTCCGHKEALLDRSPHKTQDALQYYYVPKYRRQFIFRGRIAAGPEQILNVVCSINQ